MFVTKIINFYLSKTIQTTPKEVCQKLLEAVKRKFQHYQYISYTDESKINDKIEAAFSSEYQTSKLHIPEFAIILRQDQVSV